MGKLKLNIEKDELCLRSSSCWTSLYDNVSFLFFLFFPLNFICLHRYYWIKKRKKKEKKRSLKQQYIKSSLTDFHQPDLPQASLHHSPIKWNIYLCHTKQKKKKTLGYINFLEKFIWFIASPSRLSSHFITLSYCRICPALCCYSVRLFQKILFFFFFQIPNLVLQ